VKLNLSNIESSFSYFLEKKWQVSAITPFLLVYIDLIMLFKDELSQIEINATVERQNQLRGESFKDFEIYEIRRTIRNKINTDLKNGASTMREGVLNRMLFCALLDMEESDFFYLTEPIFEFSRIMDVSPNQLRQILESEFEGYKA
jgi:hypothetical protein